MPDIYRVSLTDIDGRYVTIEDEAEFIGPWLFRTIQRLSSDDPQFGYHMHRIEFSKVGGR